MDIFSYDIYSKIPSHCDYITFGMGCFWGAEKRFWTLKGVKTTIVGYAGGDKENPSYEEVCAGTTGHAEVVKVIFEKNKLPLHTFLGCSGNLMTQHNLIVRAMTLALSTGQLSM